MEDFLIFNRFPIGILLLGSSKKVADCNAAFLKNFQCQRQDVVGQGIESMIGQIDRKGMMALGEVLARTATAPLDVKLLLRISHKDYFSRLQIVPEGDGFLAFVDNLEEMQKLQEELHALKNRWSTLNSFLGDGILILDAQDEIVELNQRFLEVLPLRDGDGKTFDAPALGGKNFLGFFSQHDSLYFQNAIRAGQDDTHKTSVFEFRFEKRYLQFRITAIFDEAQRFSGTCVVVSDVTENKNLEQAVVRSEKMAAIGLLASGVGHELRNPLGAIHNALYYIKDVIKDSEIVKADPTVLEFADLAVREIKNAGGIVKDLLDFSRIVSLNVAPANVNAVLEEMNTVLEIPGNIKIIHSLTEGLPAVSMDAPRMRQVFINLANNAIQAMTQGGELSILTRLAAGQQEVEVVFKDTGSGISPENLEKIFEPLFTTKARGTGLGLAICKQFVDKHGGRILVESEVGKGSTFIIRLPLKSEGKISVG